MRSQLEARLGLVDATALVAGSMIGSGIFIVSADIARRLPGPGWLLLVWALAGALTVAGASSYGRLAAVMLQKSAPGGATERSPCPLFTVVRGMGWVKRPGPSGRRCRSGPG